MGSGRGKQRRAQINFSRGDHTRWQRFLRQNEIGDTSACEYYGIDPVADDVDAANEKMFRELFEDFSNFGVLAFPDGNGLDDYVIENATFYEESHRYTKVVLRELVSGREHDLVYNASGQVGTQMLMRSEAVSRFADRFRDAIEGVSAAPIT